jgi:DNA replication ATP-dependent helicase Dna2
MLIFYWDQARPQWQRNKSTNDISRDRNDRNACPKQPADGPQVALSAQTKSKLKAFEFSAPSDIPKSPVAENDHADKENSSFLQDPTMEDGMAEPGKGSLQFPSTQGSVKPPIKDCPRTPVPRLPLADLIGTSGEDVPQRDVAQEISPERVFWKHITPENAPQSITTPSHFLRRGKRARSSSPISSPHAMSELNPNRQSLQKTLRTPQADPAMELWNRYSMNTANKSTAKLSPDFTRLLINGSSPRPPGIRTSPGSTLRRSLSCGMEWPTSKAKRRKTAGLGTDSSDDVFFAPADDIQETPAKSKLSRVSLLVDKLQESLSHPTRMVNNDGRSSSSPLPCNGDPPTSDHSSPLRKARGNVWEGQIRVPLPPEEGLSSGEITASQHVQVRENSSSEFGDFDEADIDMDILNATESIAVIVTDTTPQRKAGKETLHSGIAHGSLLDRVSSEATEEDKLGVLDAPISSITINDDMALDGFGEFDGSDEEMFAADLEDIVARYDMQRPPSGEQADAQVERTRDVETSPQSMAQTEEPHIGVSEDEFGDLDDADLEGLLASEAVFTHTSKEKSPSQTIVCTRSSR